MRRPDSIDLRPIGAADRDFLFEVFYDAREAELDRAGWPRAIKREFLRGQFELQDRYYRAHYPNAQFAVVEHAGERVGRWYLDSHPTELRLIDIAFLKAWRRRGLGSALLASLIGESNASARPIVLHVEAENPALALYCRLGFEEIDTNGVYLKMRRSARREAA